MASLEHSWSQIANFRKCPKKGAYGYQSSRTGSGFARGNTSSKAILGKLHHEVIGQVLKEEGFPDGREAIEYLLESTELNEFPSMALVPENEKESVRSTVHEVLRKWGLICLQEFKNHEVEEVEASFNLDLDGIRFTGRVDAVSKHPRGNIWVIDWKSGRIRRRHRTQIGSYAVWAREEYLPEEEGVIGALVDLGTGNKKTLEVDATVDARLRTRLRTICQKIENKIEAGETPARPGSRCESCAFLERCEEGTEYVQNTSKR